MYNRLLKNHQDWMKYYTALIEWTKPNESELNYQFCKSYAQKLIEEVNPAVIVSVHPMVNQFMARTLKDLGLAGKIKLITVLTDPNAHLWTGWACVDADLTIAPNDLARDRLIALGLDPSIVKVIGMPIPPEFLKPPSESRHHLLSRLGLDPDAVTIAISAGSTGGGNMPKIYQALQQVRKPVQVIFVCGENARLKAKMERLCEKSPVRTVVVGYANLVADGMNACDLLVTKAGGLTTFEAIARRLPMAIDMLTEPMPQEAGTVKMLIEAGLAKPIRRSEDIVPIVEALEVIHERLNMPLPAVHSLDQIDAVYEIAQTILTFA
jgi:UDP-N-acetylglucosamine:LPS N-acetylglucosamine transferase